MKKAVAHKAFDAVVALRKESVDRNLPAAHCAILRRVALRKESVDRNIKSLTAL